jgi:hypothetical protein
VVDLIVGVVAVLTVLGLVGFASHRIKQRKRSAAVAAASEPVEKPAFNISFAPSDIAWSGSSHGDLPLKTLTYKQYECLEDARYGFKIVGVPPSARKDAQPHKTRAHGQKTVASLAKHGFVALTDDNTYVITDHGLNALEVCDVRY